MIFNFYFTFNSISILCMVIICLPHTFAPWINRPLDVTPGILFKYIIEHILWQGKFTLCTQVY